jgi:hypothetical protein
MTVASSAAAVARQGEQVAIPFEFPGWLVSEFILLICTLVVFLCSIAVIYMCKDGRAPIA